MLLIPILSNLSLNIINAYLLLYTAFISIIFIIISVIASETYILFIIIKYILRVTYNILIIIIFSTLLYSVTINLI